MGYTDEAAVWQVLIQPITVLDANQRHQVKIRKEPDKNCTVYTGEVTGASQGVHVLERGEEWSLIEAYSSSPEGSKVKVWAEKFQGYVETSLLKEVEVDQQYAIVIDKQWQRLYLYKEGKLFSTLLCSTGFYNPKKKNPWNETPAGEFLAISWTGDFSLKDETTGEGYMICKKAIRINDGILLHEVPMVLSKSTGEWTYDNCEGYLGEKASHGCIRVQRNFTPEGVNHEWLWKNLSDGTKPGQKYTKVIIWDDANRELSYPSDDLTLYYNTDKGTRYHSSPTCYGVKEKFWPLTPFKYGELDEAPYNAVSDRILPDRHTAPPDGNPATAPLLPPPSAGCGSQGAYDLVLRTDDSWKGSLKVLCSAVHNFVVHHVVYHYLQLTAPTFAPAFGEQAEETLNRIGNYMRINHPIKNHLLWT